MEMGWRGKRRFMKRTFLGIVLAVVFCWGSFAFSGTYLEFSKAGRIDWTNGILEADGVGSPPSKPENRAHARAVARSRAVTAARHNLYQLILGIRVRGKTTVAHLMHNDSGREAKVRGFVRAAEVVEVLFRPDGHVEATVAMKFSPSFLDTLLPPDIKVIRPVKQPRAEKPSKSNGYTGLIIDCRGLGLLPSLVPRVVGEDGNMVFGSALVSRDYATKGGIAIYVRGLKEAQGIGRAGKKPLVLKAIRTAPEDRTTAVISKADARKVLDDPLNLRLLHYCRLIFVVE